MTQIQTFQTSAFHTLLSTAVHGVSDWQWHGIGVPVFWHGKFTKWRFTAQQHVVEKRGNTQHYPCPFLFLTLTLVWGSQYTKLSCYIFWYSVHYRLVHLSIELELSFIWGLDCSLDCADTLQPVLLFAIVFKCKVKVFVPFKAKTFCEYQLPFKCPELRIKLVL